MDAALSLLAILFLGAASILGIMAILRMFKGTASRRGQLTGSIRDRLRMDQLARSGARVPDSYAEPVREMVEQQLDMLERIEAAWPLTLWGVGLFAVGITLFALVNEEELLSLLLVVAVVGGFWLLSTAFTTWILRKYEATAAANGWITYSDEQRDHDLPG